jgi:hypothetical protein
MRNTHESQYMRAIQSHPNAFRPPLASVILQGLWSSTLAMPLACHNGLDPMSGAWFPFSRPGAQSGEPQRVDAGAEFVIAW